MTLYHGSASAIESPDIRFCRNNTDFGRGFYTTQFKEQAQKWAARFKRRVGEGIVSSYNFNEEKLSQFSIKMFDGYSDDWLDFVINCRNRKAVGDYDLITGCVANDKVFDCLELFFEGLIDKKEAIKRLRYEQANDQYCFRSQRIIDECLVFLGAEKLL